MTGIPGKLPDQQALWTGNYSATPDAVPEPSVFLQECAPLVPPGSRVLELGCGEGADAVALAALGHDVTATDFVARVIARNRQRHAGNPHLHFQEMRIDAPFPFGDATFDAVYAHLTLHYFTDEVTRSIFRKIRRVLRPDGMLMFACKSDRDPLYGRGIEIEPDMYDLDGHIRHFFTESYARACLAEGFALDRLSTSGQLRNHPGYLITAIARAT